MNWTWNVRSNDGGMNGLEFARCTTAGGFDRVLIDAAPGKAKIEVIADDDRVVARADLGPPGGDSPMTPRELDRRGPRPRVGSASPPPSDLPPGGDDALSPRCR